MEGGVKRMLWFNDVSDLDMELDDGKHGFELLEKEAPWIGRDDQAQ